MARVFNSEVTQEIRNAGKIQSAEMPSFLLNGQVVPVIEVNPKLTKNIQSKGAIRTTSGANTLFQQSASKDTYLVGVIFSMVKDATCDVASGQVVIQCYINGAAQTIANIAVLTTTAQSQTVAISFPHPLKIDRYTSGNVVEFGNQTFTAGAMIRVGTVFYYEDETTNA